MEAHSTVKQWLHAQHYGDITRLTEISGGCINECARLQLSGHQSLFLKQHLHPPEGFYRKEVAGLRALKGKSPLTVPAVIHCASTFLLLEDLTATARQTDYWEKLGIGLAILHKNLMPHFGFDSENYCGTTPQPNPVSTDGHRFFAHHRLLYQSNLAQSKKLLSAEDIEAIDSIARRLEELIPEQPAVLLHGDLWSGNVHVGNRGEPALIDPAVYWGWAESDLAMTTMFGGFPESFYAAYEDCASITRQWRERAELYNLDHLLNHLNLFGPSYLSQIRAVVRKYS